ncbi:MAG: hypothetical protein K0S68_61 [Candidatus Saccharibacteria bacterium]|nr:hypothetical protein [Candidatus Saccharibacteria bacterium]
MLPVYLPCLYNDGRHLNLTTTDTELVILVADILDLNNVMSKKRSGHNSIGYHFQFGDVSLYDFFVAAGITPAKSLTISKVDVPDDCFPDFLRGYFDGDGSICSFVDKRWKNSTMTYVSFCSGSDPFLAWLQVKITQLTGIRTGSFRPANDDHIGTLRYAKADTRRLYEFMYYTPGLPALSRKYLKFVDFLNSNGYDIEVPRASGGMVYTLV